MKEDFTRDSYIMKEDFIRDVYSTVYVYCMVKNIETTFKKLQQCVHEKQTRKKYQRKYMGKEG